jgi:hypothetical protein
MPATYESLVSATIELGKRHIVMPIEEMQLASALASLPNSDNVVARMISELFSHPNMHVRRIAISASRRSKAFGVIGLRDALTFALNDPEAWVRYDATWAIQEAGFDSPEIRELLTSIAKGSMPEDKEQARKHPANAELRARLRASELLEALRMSSKNF